MTTRQNIKLLFGIIGLILGFLPTNTEAKEKLILRGSDNYPPFEFINEAGEPDGFNVDIIRALMKECNYKYELKLDDWEKVTDEIQDKKIDIIIGMIYSPERAESLRFSLPTCVINRNYITRKADNCKSFDELSEKNIIVEKGGWFHGYLLKNNFSGKIIESDDIYESLKLLKEGKHDAVLANNLVAIYGLKELGIKDFEIKDMGIAPQNYSIAVNQDNDQLLYHLNLGLQRLKYSGTYDNIYNKWFGVYEFKKNNENLPTILIVVACIIFLLILFIWLLRKQVAKATRMLNRSKQEVEIVIDAGKIAAWTYTIHDQTVTFLYGKPFGIANCSIDEVYKTLHPDDVPLLQHELKALSSKQKQRATVSFRIWGDESEQYHYIETKMAWTKATRELPSRIVGTYKDITEDVLMRKKLEDYRIKSELITKANDIILIQYDITNQLFIRINNLEEQSSYNINEYMTLVYPEDTAIASRFIDHLNAGKDEKIESEFRIISDDGIYYWYTITAFAYAYDENGKITSYMGLRRNNTKWKKINNDLILLREKADISNRLKSAFLANMSHEIRTPLNAIVGFSELLSETEDVEERNNFIEIIKTNNNLLLQLINDVLDLSKIEAGHIDFNFSIFDFSSYFQELALSLKIKETKDVCLKYTNRYSDLKIYSDKNRISQVIINFVTNAFKFTKSGNITMDYLYENEGIKVSVTDTGIGIADENLARIFERFEKINSFAQGTGLGLSISKVIIENLNGKIGVQSKLGEGSTFWFWLPCNTGMSEIITESEIPAIKSSISDTIKVEDSIKKQSFSENKKTILIADDIDNNFHVINLFIKNEYNVIRAINGLDAVNKVKQYNPDIILMDMKMPVMDGLDATKEIRKFNPHIPIIALTAYVFDTNREDAIEAGCNQFLSKPLNRSVLIQTLNEYK